MEGIGRPLEVLSLHSDLGQGPGYGGRVADIPILPFPEVVIESGDRERPFRSDLLLDPLDKSIGNEFPFLFHHSKMDPGQVEQKHDKVPFRDRQRFEQPAVGNVGLGTQRGSRSYKRNF